VTTEITHASFPEGHSHFILTIFISPSPPWPVRLSRLERLYAPINQKLEIREAARADQPEPGNFRKYCE
jgi:hypothetical protein